MKTLVIHPKDITTDVLCKIYDGKDWTVINENVSKSALKEAINTHDRIIMMGHGSGQGLYGFNRLVIDSTYVYLLKEKDLVCIWCNADLFVKTYELRGFYTGMVVSEVSEAMDYSIIANFDEITESNELFSKSIKDAIDLTPKEMHEQVLKEYIKDDNNIVNFNKNNIYWI